LSFFNSPPALLSSSSSLTPNSSTSKAKIDPHSFKAKKIGHHNFESNFSCDHVLLTSMAGSFYNPGYPNYYSNETYCSWHIIGKPNQVITISLDDLDINNNEDNPLCSLSRDVKFQASLNKPCCFSSGLLIKPLNNASSAKIFCGRSEESRLIYETFVSNASRVDIYFKGNYLTKGGRGFHATYQITQVGKLCDSNEYKCSNGKCIPKAWICNQRDECGDGSDEVKCDYVCRGPNQVRCEDEEPNSFSCYLFPSERCDGTWNCKNGTDERGCSKCPGDMFLCSSGRICYKESKRCDGVVDCDDYKDELNCGFCGPGKVPCGSDNLKECYNPLTQHCNGQYDCSNGNDEKGCSPCANQILCASTSKCYPPENRCNGIQDCDDASDEKNCTLELCRPDRGTFLCANRRCIRSIWICDRGNDCGDFSDESDCLKNSVITAALMGLLICGLLLVIAISCTCKLITLRQQDHHHYHHHHHHNSSDNQNCVRYEYSHPSYMYNRYFPFRGNNLNSSLLLNSEQSYIYAEPPPSYAASVNSMNSVCRQNRRVRRVRRPRTRQCSPLGQLQETDENISQNNNASSTVGNNLNQADDIDQESQDFHSSMNKICEETKATDAMDCAGVEAEAVSSAAVSIELSNIQSPIQLDSDQQPLLN